MCTGNTGQRAPEQDVCRARGCEPKGPSGPVRWPEGCVLPTGVWGSAHGQHWAQEDPAEHRVGALHWTLEQHCSSREEETRGQRDRAQASGDPAETRCCCCTETNQCFMHILWSPRGQRAVPFSAPPGHQPCKDQQPHNPARLGCAPQPHSPAPLIVEEQDKEKLLLGLGLHVLTHLQHVQGRGRDGDAIVVARHSGHLGVNDLPNTRRSL